MSKAHADVVLISGHDGGTGASPLTSVKHAGAPWELGLAETQQTLLLNDLRDRIVVQTDGQLKTGRDVMIAALLGAEESASPPRRSCDGLRDDAGLSSRHLPGRHRDPEPGAAREVLRRAGVRRELLPVHRRGGPRAARGARLPHPRRGHRSGRGARHHRGGRLLEGVGPRPVTDPAPARHRKEARRHHFRDQDHGLERALDQTLIQLAEGAITEGRPVSIDIPIRNVNRTVGTLLGFEVTKAHAATVWPDDTIVVDFSGSAGNSFGAFVPRGITLRLEGDANDYVGKGLSGGRIVVRPPADAPFVAEENVIAGNVIAYGATGGEIFLRGVVGERFCVRNSGAVAVVEGIGDHGCEYMTGGRAVILGPTGRNFAAGMSGGVAFVHDPDGLLPRRVNHEMVELEELVDDDLAWLRDRVEKHRHETGSEVAARILADWGTTDRRIREGDALRTTGGCSRPRRRLAPTVPTR